MKKILACILAMAMVSSTLSVAASASTTNDTANIQYITTDEYDSQQLKEFLNNGGIVIDTRSESYQSVADDLGVEFSVSENLDTESANNDCGRDIATLYYKYGDDVDGVYIINVGSDDTVNQNALINEAIDVIRLRQASNYVSSEETIIPNTPERAATAYTTKVLGTFDVTTTREPKGKLNSTYKIYTVQNYSQKDYYIIKATVTGYPGCTLGSAYESKYQGEGMYVSIGTSTSSVTVDDYGPSRDIASGSTSYGVSLGSSFDGEDFTVEFGLNYTESFNTTDTTVSTTGTSTSRAWDIQLDDAAQETFFDFSPGVTFDCPYNKTSMEISVYSSYDLDSWNTAVETISSNRTITCSPSTATIS